MPARPDQTRGWRVLAALLAVLAVVAFGCGGKSREKKAEDRLNAGLEEVVAGRIDDAKRDFAKVLESDPANKFALYNLGYIAQVYTNDPAEAEQRYRAVLAVDPQYAPALFNLAIVVTPKNLEEAIDLYRRTIAVTPKDASAHLNLGFALIQAHQRKEGERELATAVRLNPALKSRLPRNMRTGRPSSTSPTPAAS